MKVTTGFKGAVEWKNILVRGPNWEPADEKFVHNLREGSASASARTKRVWSLEEHGFAERLLSKSVPKLPGGVSGSRSWILENMHSKYTRHLSCISTNVSVHFSLSSRKCAEGTLLIPSYADVINAATRKTFQLTW